MAAPGALLGALGWLWGRPKWWLLGRPTWLRVNVRVGKISRVASLVEKVARESGKSGTGPELVQSRASRESEPRVGKVSLKSEKVSPESGKWAANRESELRVGKVNLKSGK